MFFAVVVVFVVVGVVVATVLLFLFCCGENVINDAIRIVWRNALSTMVSTGDLTQRVSFASKLPKKRFWRHFSFAFIF